MLGVKSFGGFVGCDMKELLIEDIAIVDAMSEPHQRTRRDRFLQQDSPRQCRPPAQTRQGSRMIADYPVGPQRHEFFTAYLRPADHEDEIHLRVFDCAEAFQAVGIESAKQCGARPRSNICQVDEVRVAGSSRFLEGHDQIERPVGSIGEHPGSQFGTAHASD